MYYCVAGQLFQCGQLEEMVTELTDMGFIDAAKETFALKTLIDQTKVRMEVYLIVRKKEKDIILEPCRR